MKTKNNELRPDIFTAFTLSNEEMNHIRGGEIDPIIKTTVPPIKI